MSAALGLYRLQQIDSQMDQARARLEAIRQTLENDLELRAATERVVCRRDLHTTKPNAPNVRPKRKSNPNASRSNRPNPACMAARYATRRNCRICKRMWPRSKNISPRLEDRLLEAMLAADSAASSLTEARAAY